MTIELMKCDVMEQVSKSEDAFRDVLEFSKEVNLRLYHEMMGRWNDFHEYMCEIHVSEDA
jgi:hypothetical protein